MLRLGWKDHTSDRRRIVRPERGRPNHCLASESQIATVGAGLPVLTTNALQTPIHENPKINPAVRRHRLGLECPVPKRLHSCSVGSRSLGGARRKQEGRSHQWPDVSFSNANAHSKGVIGVFQKRGRPLVCRLYVRSRPLFAGAGHAHPQFHPESFPGGSRWQSRQD